MIPANTSPSTTYNGNRTASTFPFYFRALRASDIVVTVIVGTGSPITLVQGVDYSFSYNSFPQLGGQITLISAGQSWIYTTNGTLENGSHLTVKYAVSPSQDSKFRDWGPLAPLLVEQEFDRLTMDLIAVYNMIGSGGSGLLSPVFPDLAGQGGKIVQVKSDASGFEYGVTAQSVLDAATAAAASQVAAAGSATSASSSAATATTKAAQTAQDKIDITALKADVQAIDATASQKAVDAGVSAAQAASSSTDAATAALAAQAQVTLAAAKAQDAQQAVDLTFFTSVVSLTFVDSPYQVLAADKGKLFRVDTTGGSFVFNLPTIQADPDWRVSVVKTDTSPNTITTYPYGADTVAGGASEIITQQIYGRTYYHGLFSNWLSRIFIDNSASSFGAPGNVGGIQFSSSVQNIAANGFIVPGSAIQQAIDVQGNGGPQVANAVPFSANPAEGIIITLVGQDDSKILTVLHNDALDGCYLKQGDCYLGKNDTLTLVYRASTRRYIELFRSVH